MHQAIYSLRGVLTVNYDLRNNTGGSLQYDHVSCRDQSWSVNFNWNFEIGIRTDDHAG